MTDTRIDELLAKAGSKFELVIGASKRTRQITDFLNARTPSDMSSEHSVPPPVSELMIKKPLMIALDEIADGKIEIVHVEPSPEEGEITPEEVASMQAEAILSVKSPEETMEAGSPQENIDTEPPAESPDEMKPDES
jgi:DNA-directed RNA polymerase subunit omega